MATRGQVTEQAVLVNKDEYRKRFPTEAYVDETYWADLPFAKRARWMLQQQREEESKELKAVWKIFKLDPLEPFVIYWKRYVTSGMGLFTEGYVLFSISNIHTLFQAAHKDCWKQYKTCDKIWTETTDYFQVVGIILGQAMVGFLGDWLGRRWGMIQDAMIMLLGAVMIACATGTTPNGWVIMYAVSQLVYGVGVGGEYPMTGTQAAEKETPGSRADKLHRGRNVVLAFTMQASPPLLLPVPVRVCACPLQCPESCTEANLWYWPSPCSHAFLFFLLYLCVCVPLPNRRHQRCKVRLAFSMQAWAPLFVVLLAPVHVCTHPLHCATRCSESSMWFSFCHCVFAPAFFSKLASQE